MPYHIHSTLHYTHTHTHPIYILYTAHHRHSTQHIHHTTLPTTPRHKGTSYTYNTRIYTTNLTPYPHTHHTPYTYYTYHDAHVTQAHNTHTHTRTHSGPSQESLKWMQISLKGQKEQGEFTAHEEEVPPTRWCMSLPLLPRCHSLPHRDPPRSPSCILSHCLLGTRLLLPLRIPVRP